MNRRFWWSLAFTVPLLLLAMFDAISGRPVSHLLGRWFPWLQLILATPVVFSCIAAALCRGEG